MEILRVCLPIFEDSKRNAMSSNDDVFVDMVTAKVDVDLPISQLNIQVTLQNKDAGTYEVCICLMTYC